MRFRPLQRYFETGTAHSRIRRQSYGTANPTNWVTTNRALVEASVRSPHARFARRSSPPDKMLGGTGRSINSEAASKFLIDSTPVKDSSQSRRDAFTNRFVAHKPVGKFLRLFAPRLSDSDCAKRFEQQVDCVSHSSNAFNPLQRVTQLG